MTFHVMWVVNNMLKDVVQYDELYPCIAVVFTSIQESGDLSALHYADRSCILPKVLRISQCPRNLSTHNIDQKLLA